MIKFKEYFLLNEAIPLIIAKNALGRKHAPLNYTEEMNKAFNNKDRIILPFNAKIKSGYSETQEMIERRLGNIKNISCRDVIKKKYGYSFPFDTEEMIKDFNKCEWENRYFFSDDDYNEGYAYRYKIESDFLKPSIIPDMRQKFKIGKILQELGETDLLDAFKKDESRQFKNKEFVIVISRHPYDIAGASDDRNWHSCITHSFPPIVYKDKKEKDERTGSYSKRIDRTDDYTSYDELKSGNYDFERERCDERSIIAYLVPKEELMKNEKIALRKPVSRMLFLASDDEDDYTFIVSDSNVPVYGLNNDDFKKEVEKWMSSHFTYHVDDEGDDQMDDEY